jgi:hypothetical protein
MAEKKFPASRSSRAANVVYARLWPYSERRLTAIFAEVAAVASASYNLVAEPTVTRYDIR